MAPDNAHNNISKTDKPSTNPPCKAGPQQCLAFVIDRVPDLQNGATSQKGRLACANLLSIQLNPLHPLS